MKRRFKPNQKKLRKERHNGQDIVSFDSLEIDNMGYGQKIEPIGYVSPRTCQRWRREDGLGKGEFY